MHENPLPTTTIDVSSHIGSLNVDNKSSEFKLDVKEGRGPRKRPVFDDAILKVGVDSLVPVAHVVKSASGLIKRQ